MSISKYKKWMTEAFLYEDREDVMNQYIKNKDGRKIKVKTAYDDPTHTLHKKAKAMVDKATGGGDKVKKPKGKSVFDTEKPVDEPDPDKTGELDGDDKEVERDKDGVPENEMDFVDELDDVVDNYKEMKDNYEQSQADGDPDDPEEKEQMDLDRVEYRKAEDKLRKYRAKAKRQGWDDEEDVHDKLYGDDEPKGDEEDRFGIPNQDLKDTILQDLNPPRDAERDELGLPTTEEDWDKEMDEVESLYKKARDYHEDVMRKAADSAFGDDEEEAEYYADKEAEAEKEFNKYKAVRDAYEEKGQELGVYGGDEEDPIGAAGDVPVGELPDRSDDDETGDKEEIKAAREELAQAEEYLEFSQEELKMAQDPDEIERAKRMVAQDKKEVERAKKELAFLYKRDREKSESIKVINGKKYKAIKESVNKKVTVKEVKSWLKKLEEFRYRKIPGVDVRRITSFVNNGLSETDLPKSLQKKWENAKYSKEKGLADRFMKERINKKLTQNESKHPLKEQYDRLFKNKVVL